MQILSVTNPAMGVPIRCIKWPLVLKGSSLVVAFSVTELVLSNFVPCIRRVIDVGVMITIRGV